MNIISPQVIDNIQRTLARANGEGLRVSPRGGNTTQERFLPPADADIALDLTQLNHIVEYEPANLTITVEAGMTLATLQATLHQHRQFLPLDPPLPERATIGGILAANAHGPLRFRYGTARDWLIGVRVVLADGTVVKGGGRVVKNVAGYDMPKLFIGSYGTLGVIAEATFKVAPLPPVTRTLLAAAASAQIAASILPDLLHQTPAPHAVEILDPTLAELVAPTLAELVEANPHPEPVEGSADSVAVPLRDGVATSPHPEPVEGRADSVAVPLRNGVATSPHPEPVEGWCVAVQFAGTAATVERQCLDFAALCAKKGISQPEPAAPPRADGVEGGEAEGALWHALRTLPTSLHAPDAVTLELRVLPSQIGETLASVHALAAAHGLACAAYARAGLAVWAVLRGEPAALVEAVAALREAHASTSPLAGSAQAARNDYLIVHRVPELLRPLVDTGRTLSAPQGAEVMQRIKEQFDPNRILNPGAVVV